MADPLGQGIVGPKAAQVAGVGVDCAGESIKHSAGTGDAQDVLQGGTGPVLQAQHGVHGNPGTVGDLSGGEVAKLAPVVRSAPSLRCELVTAAGVLLVATWTP